MEKHEKHRSTFAAMNVLPSPWRPRHPGPSVAPPEASREDLTRVPRWERGFGLGHELIGP